MSVLEEYFVLGAVPEVDGLGEDVVVLGLEEVFDEVVDEGSLALGGLIVGAGTGAGVGVLAAGLVAGVGALRTDCL